MVSLHERIISCLIWNKIALTLEYWDAGGVYQLHSVEFIRRLRFTE